MSASIYPRSNISPFHCSPTGCKLTNRTKQDVPCIPKEDMIQPVFPVRPQVSQENKKATEVRGASPLFRHQPVQENVQFRSFSSSTFTSAVDLHPSPPSLLFPPNVPKLTRAQLKRHTGESRSPSLSFGALSLFLVFGFCDMEVREVASTSTSSCTRACGASTGC